ncbi:hypothetical protein [Pseudodesulfovibrio sp.]|uniref:hypothetical protein n=1 Tax=unclassified Pseudodesulfovibrio TaxID=2661612 RepID=UPI003AFFB219
MRTSHNRTIASSPMPFAGLGMSMASVRVASRWMRPKIHRNDVTTPVFTRPTRDAMRHLGGYGLLVAQGREIRGR